ncbi:hypothetical protein PG996_009902 [Apiospora saccharicola]|uniref:Uncharacterized protein n=1 Tax=Apiospora saccharicola TaxID=335842 RepID=A0ABR1UM37_9PEZI
MRSSSVHICRCLPPSTNAGVTSPNRRHLLASVAPRVHQNQPVIEREESVVGEEIDNPKASIFTSDNTVYIGDLVAQGNALPGF